MKYLKTIQLLVDTYPQVVKIFFGGIMYTMNVFNDNLIIELQKEEESSFKKERSYHSGRIVGIGAQVSVSLDLEVGDEVLFHPHMSTLVEELNWIIIPESSLIAKSSSIEELQENYSKNINKK